MLEKSEYAPLLANGTHAGRLQVTTTIALGKRRQSLVIGGSFGKVALGVLGEKSVEVSAKCDKFCHVGGFCVD